MFSRSERGFIPLEIKNSNRGSKRFLTGFTLIEILFVVILIGVLAAIAIPRIVTTAGTARQNACHSNIAIMNTQIEQYGLAVGSYPATLGAVADSTTYFPDGAPTCPTGGTYTMDGTTKRVSCSTHGTP